MYKSEKSDRASKTAITNCQKILFALNDDISETKSRIEMKQKEYFNEKDFQSTNIFIRFDLSQ